MARMLFLIGRKKSASFWILGIPVLILLLISPALLSSYGLSLLIQVLIFGLFAMSLNILVGYSGLISFNHATFFGVSAYTVAILFTRGIQNFWLLLFAGISVSVLFAVVFGLLILRCSGPYFFMLTLAFGQMVFALAWKWRSLTGGDDGLPGVERPDIGLPVSLWRNENFYYLVIAIFLICAVFIWRLVQSPFGKAVVGVRESESRMQALGYNTWAVKYLAYVISAGFAGVAGVLHVYYNGFISPHELNWTMSGMVMLMVIIGGAGTLAGPAIGAALITVLQNVISAYTERWPFFIGVIFILCVMYARNGVAGYFLNLMERSGRHHEGTGD